jgi:6-pyruvoyl-tetrahydropterin synthase
VVVRGPSLRADGTLYDLGRLRQAVRELLATLDYRNLNELPAFGGRNTTAEEVAAHLLERLLKTLSNPPIETIAVRVWESPRSYAGLEARVSS